MFRGAVGEAIVSDAVKVGGVVAVVVFCIGVAVGAWLF